MPVSSAYIIERIVFVILDIKGKRQRPDSDITVTLVAKKCCT